MDRISVGEWGIGEFRALGAAFFGGYQDSGPEIGILRTRLESMCHGRTLLFINRGRHAIDMALRAFSERQPTRTEVIFPAYICTNVIEAIERAGLIPVAADIRDDLNIDLARFETRLSNRTLAVIVADVYGCPAPIQEIEQICRSRGVFLLDDAAQLSGVSIGDRTACCYGDCGIGSFSLSKTIVAGSVNAGGFLVINNPELEPSLRACWNALPPARYSWRDLSAFLGTGALNTSACNFLKQVPRRFLLAPISPPRQCPPAKMANANAVVALHQLDSAPGRIAGRIHNAAAFQRHLVSEGLATMPQFAPGRYLARIMIQLSPGQDRASLRRRLYEQGVQTRLPYPVDSRYADGSRARDLSLRLLELPSHSRMQDGTVRRIVARLAACLVERR